MGKPTNKTKKNWRKNGEEDKHVMGLIKKGLINKDTTPMYLKKKFPEIYGAHSEQVIRNHLTDIKRDNGIYCE